MSTKGGKSLGELIKDEIKARGFSQASVAKKMNVTKQVINQLDRRKNFDLAFLVELKETTGIDFTSYGSDIDRLSQFGEEYVSYGSKENEPLQMEFAISIKIKSDPEQMHKISELILNIRREAKLLGFTVN